MPRCPTCRKHAAATPDNHWRPFCSERCKLIDLGDWIDGRHHIPGTETEAIPDPETPPTRH